MKGARVLVIDDERAIRKLLRISLESEAYDYAEAVDGRDGLAQVSTGHPDVVVLDLGLPDMDGLVVLQRIREWSQVPVIVLTVRDSEVDKVALLDAGADDYITKPFSVPELLARIRAALRHKTSPNEESHYQCGGLEVDLAERNVRMHGQPVRLTPTEYEILKLLVRHAGKIVTQRQILKDVWGPHAIEQTQYLRVHVAQLRKKLEQDSSLPRLIITEPGVGYRLAPSDAA
jgi:two-component system KDP operon response regulator KdpE